MLRFAFFSILVLGCTAKLPHFIKTCTIDDPNLNECIIKRANGALPYLVKYGHKHFSMSPLSPYDIGQVTFNSRDDFFLEIGDLNISGFEGMKATGAKLDWATNKLEITILFPCITWLADYKIDGTIFDQPISGHGKMNITYIEAFATFLTNIKIVEMEGKKHFELFNSETDYDITKIIYKFDDLYDGDEDKSKDMHKLLNEDWRIFYNELKTELTKIIINFYEMGFKSVFEYATADEIFVQKKMNTEL